MARKHSVYSRYYGRGDVRWFNAHNMEQKPKDYVPVFHDVPDDWEGRWTLLREFIRRWHRVEVRDIGQPSALAPAEEKKLGVPLPPSFREWISLAAELIEKKKFGIFRDQYAVTRLGDLSAISLLLISEGNCCWAVKEENLKLDDPPVDAYVLEGDPESEHFVHLSREAAHITGFALGHLACFLNGRGGGCGIEVQATDDFITEMKKSFAVHSSFDGLLIFEKPNIFAVLEPDPLRNVCRLLVEIWKTVPMGEIPECIKEHLSGGGSFHGMLLPPEWHKPSQQN